MTFDRFVEELPRRLRDRPGVRGQLRMAPRPRIGWRAGALPPEARSSGVLLLFYPIDGRPHIVLTVRARELAHHGGQISFPGGAVEGEETIDEAALREAHEEVGVEPAAVELVGELTALHVPVSGNVLHPRVGVSRARPAWRRDPGEVSRILEVPLAGLVDPGALRVDMRERFERSVEVPYFDVEGEKVWGATAMVLAEFLTALDRPPDPWR